MTHDPATDDAEMSFDGRMSYADYLRPDAILGAQHPLSEAHDELLFVIQHQTSELWMRLALHELDAARHAIADNRAREAYKMLSRLSRIFGQPNGARDVLRRMTPADYSAFRRALGQSSGVQSHQYRLIECAPGNRNPAMLRPHAHRPDLLARLRAELARPSLYGVALAHAARLGLPVPPDILARDPAQPWVADDRVAEAWATAYRDPARHREAHELAEKLVDIEDYVRRWQFNHVTTVERVIGLKRGTGGTSGVAYLRRMLDVQLFPELRSLRTVL
jgi:tryptophan 2,3-dioxygenase